MTGTPTDKLVVDAIVVRGDKAILTDEFENPIGIWIANYLAKSIVVRNADIQGMRTGISSPFFRGDQKPEPGRGDGSVSIENGYFRDYFGIVVATAYAAGGKSQPPLKTATVRDSVFLPLAGIPTFNTSPPAAISMNYRMASGDSAPRDPISVYNFNKKSGDNFKVFYSLDASPKLRLAGIRDRTSADGHANRPFQPLPRGPGRCHLRRARCRPAGSARRSLRAGPSQFAERRSQSRRNSPSYRRGAENKFRYAGFVAG